MKKVLVIEGSPRVSGNTDTLCDEFIRGAKEAGNEVEKIYLNQKNIHGCIGCNTCRRNGGTCVFKDDAVELNQKILEADVVLWATSVYWYSVTSQLKAVIDRTFAIEDDIVNKDYYFLYTCMAPHEGEYAKKLDYVTNVMEGYVACLDDSVQLKGVIVGDGFTKENKETHHATQEAYLMGREIA